MTRLLATATISILTLASSPGAQPAARDPSKGLTAVAGIKVGHHTLTERPTGCTVVLAERGAVGGVDVRGGAPGTREIDLLSPASSSPLVHGIVLSGGSAFGLAAADGVMRYLEEQGIGQATSAGKVPIVPAAILFDFGVGDWRLRPTADCGYRAARAASSERVPEGSVGAGAGAAVGRLGGPTRWMKGGMGTSAIAMPNGLVVSALVAVNATGDVIDPASGQVLAGVRTADGRALADARKLLRGGEIFQPKAGENTTIGVIATNAVLTKAQAQKVAQMAHDGVARAISPAHLPSDGDTIFTLATGDLAGEANVSLVGGLAAEMMAEAIVRSVREATGVPGIPAIRDLPGRARESR